MTLVNDSGEVWCKHCDTYHTRRGIGVQCPNLLRRTCKHPNARYVPMYSSGMDVRPDCGWMGTLDRKRP